MNADKRIIEAELDTLRRCADEVEESAGLSDLRKTATDYVKRFDKLTGTEKRNIIEKIVERVTVQSGNRIEIRLHGEPKQKTRLVAGWKKSSTYELNGVADGA